MYVPHHAESLVLKADRHILRCMLGYTTGTADVIDSGVRRAAQRFAIPVGASRTISASAVKAGSLIRQGLSASTAATLHKRPRDPKVCTHEAFLMSCISTLFPP